MKAKTSSRRGITVTVRDVPEEAHVELKARAERSGQSLQEYLRFELIKLSHRPDNAAILARARSHFEDYPTSISAEDILAWRDADRR
jgi:hypothetical protein